MVYCRGAAKVRGFIKQLPWDSQKYGWLQAEEEDMFVMYKFVYFM